MNCHEARGGFAEFVGCGLSLTEWATVEAHLGQCAECARLLDQLYRTAPEGHTKRRAAFTLGSARPNRRRRHATVAAVLALVMGLGILAVQRRDGVGFPVLRSALPSQSAPGSQDADSRAQTGPQEPLAPPGLLASSMEPERQDAAPPRPASPESRATPGPVAESGSPAKAPGTRVAAPAKRAAPVPVAKPKPATESASPTAASRTDVVIQLSVHDQREAVRHVETLISRLGGMRRGRERAATMILVVPRANYGALTRGLAQIGPWQMEWDVRPLPDPVYVAVKLAR